MKFTLSTTHVPAGDQPGAIGALTKGLSEGLKHQVLLGVTGSGKSVVGSTNVLVKNGRTIKLMQIGQVVDQLLIESNEATETVGGTEVLEGDSLKNLHVDSLNPITKVSEWRKVTQVTRHKSPAKLLKVTTSCGRDITVTGDHNFFAMRDGELLLLETKELRTTDLVPIPRLIPEPIQPIENLFWTDYFTPDTPLYLESNSTIIEMATNYLNKQDVWRKVHTNERVLLTKPLNDLARTLPLLKVGNRSGKYQFSFRQPITGNLLRFIGYYIAEGHSTKGYIVLSSGSNEVVDQLRQATKELGVTIAKRPAYDYQISSKFLTNFMGSVCGKTATKKRLPSFWTSLNNIQLAQLLSAYFSGDGGVEHNEITAATVSRDLASDINYALLRFGIVARTRSRLVRVPNSQRRSQVWVIKISGQQHIKTFLDEIGFTITVKQQKLEHLISIQSKTKKNTNVDLIPIGGKWLKSIRTSLGLFQSAIAQPSNINRSFISMIESGFRLPSRSVFIKICHVLKKHAEAQRKSGVVADIEKRLNYSKLWWSHIKEVDELPGEKYVYDFSVEGNETFLAGNGGLFVHNTFTVANVIAQVQRPTLVIAHNKTLAAQLTSEYRQFFPQSAVEYFVSYYDYYQPEAYMPNSDTYIEKEAQINDEIDRLRHAATQAVLSRRDVIVVASVSCIYGLGSAEEYQKATLVLRQGDTVPREQILKKLIYLQYQRNDVELARGNFRARGEIIEIMPSNSQRIVRISLNGDVIEQLEEIDPVTNYPLQTLRVSVIYPSRHFVTPPEQIDRAAKSIEQELEEQLNFLTKEGKLLEADRLGRRTRYDLEMIREIGYCNGIENYSRHFDGRPPGSTPNTLLNYFPDDFLLVIDESHVTVPQIGGMYNGDRARKDVLVEHGFRLPSAKDNRPLKFAEFEKKMPQTIYTSATPGPYELGLTQQTVEQIIRPTGLLDPELIIRPVEHQVKDLMERLHDRIEKKERVLVTTLTKKMAEDLADYLQEKGIKVRYLHSGIETMERIEILRDLRLGVFDVLIGVNLLREGLDLPEVSLVAILDADKEGFLRSERSLIQTIGRAARNVQGQVILYADKITDSLKKAIDETNRRRTIQEKYNTEQGITPTTISKEITSIIEREITQSVGLDKIEKELAKGNIDAMIKDKERQMKLASQELQFELAAILRDEVIKLKKMQKERQEIAKDLTSLPK